MGVYRVQGLGFRVYNWAKIGVTPIRPFSGVISGVISPVICSYYFP